MTSEEREVRVEQITRHIEAAKLMDELAAVVEQRDAQAKKLCQAQSMVECHNHVIDGLIRRIDELHKPPD